MYAYAVRGRIPQKTGHGRGKTRILDAFIDNMDDNPEDEMDIKSFKDLINKAYTNNKEDIIDDTDTNVIGKCPVCGEELFYKGQFGGAEPSKTCEFDYNTSMNYKCLICGYKGSLDEFLSKEE